MVGKADVPEEMWISALVAGSDYSPRPVGIILHHSFFETFIYVSHDERGNAASNIVGLSGCQNCLRGLLHFGRILRHAKILV
jgi:hypothetical protein